MAKNAVIIDRREKGQAPVSMGTSLALEGFVGIMKDKPEPHPIPYTQYDEIWINVRTLFRNVWTSIDRLEVGFMLPEDFAHAIIEEMHIIREWLSQYTSGRFKDNNVFFYYCTYKGLASRYPFATMREQKTDNQKVYAATENLTLKAIVEILKKGRPRAGEAAEGEEQDLGMLKGFDITIRCNGGRVVLMSNFPIDLLHVTNSRSLVLLESNTGAVKARAKWHTKLKSGNDLLRIPFDKMTIQMFGDTGLMFAPKPKDQRDLLIELSNKTPWNAITTKDRILQCIGLLKEPILEANVRNLYR